VRVRWEENLLVVTVVSDGRWMVRGVGEREAERNAEGEQEGHTLEVRSLRREGRRGGLEMKLKWRTAC
jgi:hypothetical protein